MDAVDHRSDQRTPPVKPGYSPLLAWTALGLVYVVWGSTYLGLRVAVDTLPPFAMVGVRFLLAGALLYVLTLRGTRPTRAHWRAAAVSGGLLVAANAIVAWAEIEIPSGIAALVVATVPLFMTVLDAALDRRRLDGRVVAGLALGLGGVALLVGPGGGGAGALPVGPLLAIVLAALLWAAGSVYAGRTASPERPLVGVALQMLTGGALLCVAAVFTGDFAAFDPAAVSGASLAALVYLVLIGSLVGFTAYVWTLRALRLDVAATYAFVNPVVAVALGWLILDERLTATTLVAGAVVVAGVALIVSSRGRSRRRGAAADTPEPATAATRT